MEFGGPYPMGQILDLWFRFFILFYFIFIGFGCLSFALLVVLVILFWFILGIFLLLFFLIFDRILYLLFIYFFSALAQHKLLICFGPYFLPFYIFDALLDYLSFPF